LRAPLDGEDDEMDGLHDEFNGAYQGGDV